MVELKHHLQWTQSTISQLIARIAAGEELVEQFLMSRGWYCLMYRVQEDSRLYTCGRVALQILAYATEMKREAARDVRAQVCSSAPLAIETRIEIMDARRLAMVKKKAEMAKEEKRLTKLYIANLLNVVREVWVKAAARVQVNNWNARMRGQRWVLR